MDSQERDQLRRRCHLLLPGAPNRRLSTPVRTRRLEEGQTTEESDRLGEKMKEGEGRRE
jgi:hypothetical protein